MAHHSLTAQPFSNNDITRLAKIFEIPLRYYEQKTSPLEKDHFKEMRTLIGLGFTAILVDGDLTFAYQHYVQLFLEYSQFKVTKNNLSQLALAAAELTGGASYVFKILGYPRYYEDFTFALEKIVSHIEISIQGKMEEAEKLLEIFLRKR